MTSSFSTCSNYIQCSGNLVMVRTQQKQQTTTQQRQQTTTQQKQQTTTQPLNCTDRDPAGQNICLDKSVRPTRCPGQPGLA